MNELRMINVRTVAGMLDMIDISYDLYWNGDITGKQLRHSTRKVIDTIRVFRNRHHVPASPVVAPEPEPPRKLKKIRKLTRKLNRKLASLDES